MSSDTDHLRFFQDPAWENMALQEAEDRRRSQRLAATQVTPELAQSVADLSFAYPNLSGGMVTGMALSGIAPLSPEANAIDRRNAELAAAGLNPVPENRGFWDVGLGRAVKGITRATMTMFQSLYDEVVKGSASFLYGLGQGMSPGEAAEGSYGFSPGAIAIAQLRAGQDVDLGEGFFAGGTTTQLGLAAQAQRGVRLAGTEELYDDRFGETPGARGGLTVTPGRWVASTVTEPGTAPFNIFSGALDFSANIFLDPSNKALGWVGDWRRANRALVGNGARKSVLARPVDDWLASRHGDNVAQFIADTDDYYTLHGLFRRNAKESNVDARFIEALRSTNDKAAVKTLLSEAAKGGAGSSGVLTELPVKQGIIGRPLGTSGVAGIIARGLGHSGGAVDVLGLRQAIRQNRQTTSWLGRMSAEVGTTMLRVNDISGSVDDFGQWLQAAGFAPERIGHYMSQMAQVQPGGIETAAQMYGIVKAATREFGQQLVDEGIPAPVARAFTSMFDTVDDYRKYWIDNLGNPMFFPGGRYTIMTNGQVRALPTAQLFTEFLDWAVPLADMRRMRKALSRKAWARVMGDTAGKKLKVEAVPGRFRPNFSIENMEDWDDLGPGVANRLMGHFMQRFWKPLVLMRVAWPVRVIGEEQARMAAMGLDSVYNHPIHGLAMMLSKEYRKSYLAGDIKGDLIEETAKANAAMSRRGGTFGSGRRGNLYSNEWVKAAKNDPRYFEGLAIEIQQLADDPIASRIAQAIIDGQETGASFADILKPIKDAFWEGDLTPLRDVLAKDGQHWKLLTAREAADGYIDSVFGRIVHKAGGEVVYADTVRGTWKDMYGNVLEKVDGTANTFRNPQTGATYELSKPPRARGLLKNFAGDEETKRLVAEVENQLSYIGGAVRRGELDAIGFQEVEALIDDVETLVGGAGRISGGDPVAVVDDIYTRAQSQRPDDLRQRLYELDPADPSEREWRGLLYDVLRLKSALDEAKGVSGQELRATGNANWRALDLIETSGKPELVRLRWSGYEPQPGMPTIDELAEKSTWTPQELARAFEGKGVYDEPFRGHAAPAHIPSEGTHVYTVPGAMTDEGALETIEIAHNGIVTGFMTIRRSADGTVNDVVMLKVSRGTKVNKNWKPGSATKPLVDDPNSSTALYRNDAARLLAHAMGRQDLNPADVAELGFNGVPIREWLQSAGIGEMETFSVLELLEMVRHQHGAAWSGRFDGPLGELPSIELSSDGAAVLGRTMLQITDERMWERATPRPRVLMSRCRPAARCRGRHSTRRIRRWALPTWI